MATPFDSLSDEELLSLRNEYSDLTDDQFFDAISPKEAQATPPVASSPNYSFGENVDSLSKGLIKGVPSFLTAPADLLYRGGNAALEALGVERKANEAQFAPSNLVSQFADWVYRDADKINPSVEKGGEAIGTVASILNAPSAIPKTIAATRSMATVPRVVSNLAVGGAEGGAWGAAMAAKDPNANLLTEAKKGAALGAVTTGAIPAIEDLMSMAANSGLSRMVGYNPESKARVAGGLDEAGQVTQDASQAVSLVSKKDIQLKNLKESGFTNTLSAGDSPEKVALKLWQFQQSSGKTIGEVIDQAIPAEQQLLRSSDLAAWEKHQLINPPNFSSADEFVASVTQSDPVSGAALQTRLDSVRTAWEASDKSLAAFKTMQENLGVTGRSSFNAGKTSAESFSDTLNNIMYGEVAQSLKARVQAIGDAIGVPALATKFEEANKAYSAATTFKDSAFTASRQAVTSKIAESLNPIAAKTSPLIKTALTLGLPLAEAVAPVATMKGSQALSDLMAMTSKVPMGNAVVGGVEAVLSRDWDEVKNDPKAMASLANIIGAPVDQLRSLPEPVQMQMHEQAILMNPDGASPVPGNYTVVNNKYAYPMEKDYAVKKALDSSAEERARVIGASFTNRFEPLGAAPVPPPRPVPALPLTMDKLNSALSIREEPNAIPTFQSSPDQMRMLEELTASKILHERDIQ